MLRFDNLIRPGMTVREVRVAHPATASVLEAFGFRPSCDDCSLTTVARKYGLNIQQVVEALNEAAFPELAERGPGGAAN
jgi:hypothetical protein